MQEKFKKMFSLQNCAKILLVTKVDQRSYNMAKEILKKTEQLKMKALESLSTKIKTPLSDQM